MDMSNAEKSSSIYQNYNQGKDIQSSCQHSWGTIMGAGMGRGRPSVRPVPWRTSGYLAWPYIYIYTYNMYMYADTGAAAPQFPRVRGRFLSQWGISRLTDICHGHWTLLETSDRYETYTQIGKQRRWSPLWRGWGSIVFFFFFFGGVGGGYVSDRRWVYSYVLKMWCAMTKWPVRIFMSF